MKVKVTYSLMDTDSGEVIGVYRTKAAAEKAASAYAARRSGLTVMDIRSSCGKTWAGVPPIFVIR